MAKVTQAKYGASKKAAVLLIFKKALIVSTIEKSKTIIITNPQYGFLSPKNTGVQIPFKKSCVQKIWGTFFFFQTKYKDTPIRKYKVVQTGPNIQLGGVNAGFTNSGYHVSIEPIVKYRPIKAAL